MKLADSGHRVEFDSGCVRETECVKGRCDLLPMSALIKLSKQFEEANKKYPERNWEKGMPMHCLIDSALRHLFKYMDGQNDEDHLLSACWNVVCAVWMEEKHPDMQDIPARLELKKSTFLSREDMDSGEKPS